LQLGQSAAVDLLLGSWRLPAGARERKRAEAELGNLLFDVEGQDALAAYLREVYDSRLSVKARAGGAPKLLRLAP
jgi:hypothetical protein